MGAPTTLLCASDVARICAVDLKSIHNWCDKRGLPHFRTPGRHLRFKPAELVPWLRAQGFDVPAELANDAAPIIHRADAPCGPATHASKDPNRITCVTCLRAILRDAWQVSDARWETIGKLREELEALRGGATS